MTEAKDGISLTSISHPKGKGVGRGHRIAKASLEKAELPKPLVSSGGLKIRSSK